MDIREEIAKVALKLDEEMLRRHADNFLGGSITKMKEETIKSILLAKGYITLSEVQEILKPGWLLDDHEPVVLDFGAADANTDKTIMLDFNV